MSEEPNNTNTCPECGGKLIQDEQMGEVVCEDCGVVMEEGQIDKGPEWRAFDSNEREQKSRVGSPVTTTRHEKGLTTNIDWRDKDAQGQSLSSEQKNKVKRLRKWQERVRTKDASERNLQLALSEIERMASALGIPKEVQERASMIYRGALANDLIRGRSIEGVSTACLHAACREQNIPRSFEEFEDVARIEKQEIKRTYKYIIQELQIEIKPTDPSKYVPRFCSNLGLSATVEDKAKDIIEITGEKGLHSGKDPVGIAAGAIYAAAILCGEKKTQKEVAEVADVTEVTIRNQYQDQVNELGF